MLVWGWGCWVQETDLKGQEGIPLGVNYGTDIPIKWSACKQQGKKKRESPTVTNRLKNRRELVWNDEMFYIVFWLRWWIHTQVKEPAKIHPPPHLKWYFITCKLQLDKLDLRKQGKTLEERKIRLTFLCANTYRIYGLWNKDYYHLITPLLFNNYH